MIHVALFYSDKHTLCGYTLEGHADSAPHGEDIVCAAASTLAIVTENSLDIQGVHYDAEMEEGYFKLFLQEARDEKEVVIAQAVLKTLEIGLLQLAKNYPKFIETDHVFV